MRRRLRSAAFPVHRHSLPQVALDAGLVALAYYLAYRLRFDGGIPPSTWTCSGGRSRSRSSASLAVFAAWGLYRHWMRYSSQREYARIAQAVLRRTLALVAYVAVVQPKLMFANGRFVSLVGPDRRARRSSGCSRCCSWPARASRCTSFYERPLRGFRARRDARSVLIVGAGDGGRLLLREILRNPELGYRPVGFVDDDPRKQGARVDRGSRCSARPTTSARCSRTSSPTRC